MPDKSPEKKPERKRPEEVHILCCEKCEGTDFLLAEDTTILCAKCLSRVAARWLSTSTRLKN